MNDSGWLNYSDAHHTSGVNWLHCQKRDVAGHQFFPRRNADLAQLNCPLPFTVIKLNRCPITRPASLVPRSVIVLHETLLAGNSRGSSIVSGMR
ncbi:hypothetical protein HRbin17_01933 [bacterium HR17]|uniref:Uncharacterized protein n=1 Tax=Candidatus Fervidibacter japonicus TaxID=2035412 RepID=A0A2H5XDZ9_9BACT|nr:hypothetical protein HRbin17_01933 [bacterium HR17]